MRGAFGDYCKPDVRTIFNLRKRENHLLHHLWSRHIIMLASLKHAQHYPLSGNVYPCMPLNRMERHFFKILLNCTFALILIGFLPTGKVSVSFAAAVK